MKRPILPRGYMKSSYHAKQAPKDVWEQYSSYDGSHGLTIIGNQKRYQVRILDNPHFCPPETIGKKICWISLQKNELQARLYRMTYGR